MAEPTLSAVITCYEDAPAIPLMHARLSAVFAELRVQYEIIFVNDASPDDADSVLAELAARDEHVISIEHSRNFGSQSAFLSGMQIAVGDAVILLDGDLQDPPELIAEFYARWQKGNDVVYGRRQKREGSALLALLCRLFYRIFRGISEVPMPLDAGDFALMDRRVVNELLALPETDQFLRGLRAWVGFRQTGVDYVRPQRRFGRSTHGWLGNVWWARKAIFSFSFAPLAFLSYFACVLVAVSVLAAGQQAYTLVSHPERARETSLLIVVVMFFGSLNLLAVALVGEYVLKISEESKRRPKFIRKTIRKGRELFTEPRQIADFLRRRSPPESSGRSPSESMDGDED
ncbi:MAG: glycosyltransferase family 2 protein [Myxococcales bacterium]